MGRKKQSCGSGIFIPFLLLYISIIFLVGDIFLRPTAAGKGRVRIPDYLDDVVDDEEDEAWKEWGKKSKPKEFDPPPDFSEMEATRIQAEMLKRHTGPLIGFVKLRLGVQRPREEVAETAMKWTKVLRTGATAVRFMGVDTNTIMFNMEEGQNVEELKEFILNEPEAYEIKIGDNVYRRPGDPSLEEVIAMLQQPKDDAEDQNSVTEPEHTKDEF